MATQPQPQPQPQAGQLNLAEVPSWGSRSVDCFEKLEQIGEGTYGQVYMAKEIRTGEVVALKKIRMDNEREGFPITAIREIKILKKLHHDNVIQLKEIVTSPGPERDEQGRTDGNKYKGSIYMVFEYMDHDLTGLSDRPGMRFTVPQIKCYMKQLLTGLHYCHVNQVLHRDIKGSNLLIDNEGNLKLADFGLARSFSSDHNGNLTNRVITLWYRPPELLLGTTKYGPAVDMWSVGCIFAELLNGKPILPGKNEPEQLTKIFELCGTPDEINWPGVSKIPWYNNFKPSRPMKRRVREVFKHFDRHALELLERMLTLDPSQRISAKDALDAEYFWNDPLPCDPKSLPKYESSHEFQTKKKRQQRSLYMNNTLVAGDNKGVSAYLLEQAVRGTNGATDDFVAGFSQAAVADTTPNVEGAWCEDGSGQQCDFKDATCNGKIDTCHGRGPFWGLNDGGTKSCWEIGRRVFKQADKLYGQMQGGAGVPVTGKSVLGYHSFKDFSDFTFQLPNGTSAKTCAAAFGYSFAAGTTDGPGYFDFKQGDSGEPDASPFWSLVSKFLRDPTKEQVACQSPKPILIDAGEITLPYAWAPNIVDIQMLRVGNFFIIVSAPELTTMSSRRWRKSISDEIKDRGGVGSDPIVVAGGPGNTYAHYCTTPEEYDMQRYEGGSTVHGRHSLDAYINLTTSYLGYLLQEKGASKPPTGPAAPDNRKNSISLTTGVVYDNPKIGTKFGDIINDVSKSKFAVGDTISATFVGANPRNNLHLEDTYAAVEKKDGSKWVQVRTDEDWDLVFEWKRLDGLLGSSQVSITWETGWQDAKDVGSGTYRLSYYGDSKTPITGKINAFTGRSSEFTIS